MIKGRILLILLAITAAVVVAAIATSSKRSYEQPATNEEKLVPDLATRINDVGEVEITTANGKRVDLKHTDAGWVDASRGGYPARFEPIKQLLVSFADAKVAEHKTSDPANYQKLGVRPLDEEGSRATLVTLRDKKGQTIASIIIGNRSESGPGRFVRRNDESEVLLLADMLNASPTPESWLQREVIRIPRDDVQRVAIAHPDGDSFTIVRKDDGAFEMLGVPEGRRVRGQSPMAGIMGALAYVDFLNVKPMSDIDFTALRPPLIATYETKDGMQIDVSVWSQDKTKWTTLAVSKLPGFVEPQGSAASEADDASKDDSKPKPESLDEKIARLQKKLDGWAFEISPSSLVPLETSMVELTQEIPPAQPDAGPPAPKAPQPQPQEPKPEPAGSPG